MTEKVLNNKKNGMAVLLLAVLLYVGAIALTIFSAIKLDGGKLWAVATLIPGALWLLVGWLPFCGLKVLKPQEALVLTLFGKYVGSLTLRRRPLRLRPRRKNRRPRPPKPPRKRRPPTPFRSSAPSLPPQKSRTSGSSRTSTTTAAAWRASARRPTSAPPNQSTQTSSPS